MKQKPKRFASSSLMRTAIGNKIKISHMISLYLIGWVDWKTEVNFFFLSYRLSTQYYWAPEYNQVDRVTTGRYKIIKRGITARMARCEATNPIKNRLKIVT